jgi:hypothetical protein
MRRCFYTEREGTYDVGQKIVPRKDFTLGSIFDALLGVIGLSAVTNGVPETIVSVLVAYFTARAIMRKKKHGDLS